MGSVEVVGRPWMTHPLLTQEIASPTQTGGLRNFNRGGKTDSEITSGKKVTRTLLTKTTSIVEGVNMPGK